MRKDDPPRSASSFEGTYAPGAIIGGRYRMVALIGQGGMGEVYLAEDLTLGQEVALKFLSEHVEAREGGLERFFDEVRAARLVGHPNVARVHDVGEAGGRRFLSMEFVDGEDLSHLLRRIGRLPREKALEIARQLCAGLDAIHSAGILHRDLKPANVMLDGDGNVRITDFGLASSAHDLEDSDEVVGTPAYMAPEQLEGRAASERSEVFSLGLLLHELFTGKRVFQGRSLLALKAEHADRAPATPSSEVADLDPAVEETIRRCLERDPADRPASIRAVARSLPGGDPLAAAVEEGRTPAPEVVADAPDTEGMSTRAAFLCLTGFLVLVALTVTMTQRFYPSPPPYPPEVLVHEARDFLDEIGHDVSRQDSVHVFEDTFDDVRRGAGAADEGVGRGEESRAPDRMFWYRESPRDLLKWQQFRSHPSWFDPPHEVPGMVRMRMTTRGELRWFSRVPSLRLDAGVREAPDWTPFFEAAGLADLPREEVEPRWSRDVPSDRLYAWELDGDDARVPLRVEAASAGGQPVKFIVRPKDFTLPANPAPQKTGVADLLFLNTFLVLAGAVVLAVRNLKSGRAHLAGAMRLGLCMFGALMLDWIGFANHGSRLADELWILRMRLGQALYYAVQMAILYLAIEPYFRRLWPRRLVSWVRVLDGRWRDRLVGRDLLLGALVGSAGACVVVACNMAHARLDPAWHMAVRPDVAASGFWTSPFLALSNPSYEFAEYMERFRKAVEFTFLNAGLLVLLRLLLRKQVPAAGGLFALGLAFYVWWFGPGWWSLGLSVVSAALFTGLFLRVGILGYLAAAFVSSMLGESLLTFDFDAWYSARSSVTLLVVLLVGAWGFLVVTAGRPMFRDVLSEP